MSNFSNILSSFVDKIKLNFQTFKPYKKILSSKIFNLDLIILKDGKLLIISSDSKVMIYNNEYNLLSQFTVGEKLNNNISNGTLVELENEDLIICYDNSFEIRKKENNNYSLIKRNQYNWPKWSHFNIIAKKLKISRFIISIHMAHSFQVFGKDKNNDYNCIYMINFFVCHIFNISVINENQILAVDGFDRIHIFNHNFNNANNLSVKKNRSFDESVKVNIYDFNIERICIIKGIKDSRYGQKFLNKNHIYFGVNKFLYIINAKNLKIKCYNIGYDVDSIIFLPNEKFLIGIKKMIIEFEYNNNQYNKIKKCSEKVSNCNESYIKLIEGKNDNIISCSDTKILFFNKKDL